ncbi:MAG: SHOCT domain-containing protein [Alphaproteobacteria bacterium]|nr:SHOCT domain-containing protein [Alphaproteobacteria bacterium]
MRKVAGVASILTILAVAACESPAPVVDNPASADFKSNLAGHANTARVYILPTFSKSLFTDPQGRAGVVIFAEGDEKHGVLLGQTSKTSFIGFDIAAGNYDIMATGDDPLTKSLKSFSFTPNTAYYMRPVFFRSAVDIARSATPQGSPQDSGMSFEMIEAAAARTEISGLSMASLTPEGEAFLHRYPLSKRAAEVPVAAPALSAPPPPIPAAPVGGGVEQKLEQLQRLYQKNLITQQEYDGKRKVLLDAF